jgi:hypothetical protein
MKDAVTNKDLYSAILDIHKKIDEIVEKRITPLEIWKAEIMGKITFLMAILAFAFNVVVDWLKAKFFKNI